MKLAPILAMVLSLFSLEELKKDAKAVIDLGVVLIIGVTFVALIVVAYIIWTIKAQLVLSTPSGNYSTNSGGWDAFWAQNSSRGSIGNITTGFDNAVNLILVAVTIFILAIAISALLMLRGRG